MDHCPKPGIEHRYTQQHAVFEYSLQSNYAGIHNLIHVYTCTTMNLLWNMTQISFILTEIEDSPSRSLTIVSTHFWKTIELVINEFWLMVVLFLHLSKSFKAHNVQDGVMVFFVDVVHGFYLSFLNYRHGSYFIVRYDMRANVSRVS